MNLRWILLGDTEKDRERVTLKGEYRLLQRQREPWYTSLKFEYEIKISGRKMQSNVIGRHVHCQHK